MYTQSHRGETEREQRPEYILKSSKKHTIFNQHPVYICMLAVNRLGDAVFLLHECDKRKEDARALMVSVIDMIPQ